MMRGLVGNAAYRRSKTSLKVDFADLTEVTGEPVSAEQIQRMVNRYGWAARRAAGKRIVDVAAGSGSGLGLLLETARQVLAIDVSLPLLRIAAANFRGQVGIALADAQHLPFPRESVDVVAIFEASYYVPRPQAFFDEARRILTPRGELLVVLANKDVPGFVRSNHSYVYHGVLELRDALRAAGFAPLFFGDTAIDHLAARQRFLGPLKRVVASLGWVPSTMRGRKLLRRAMYGRLQSLPADLRSVEARPVDPTPISPDAPDTRHKVLFCLATKSL